MSDLRPMDERDDFQIAARTGSRRLKRALRDGEIAPGLEPLVPIVRELLEACADHTLEEVAEMLGPEEDDDEDSHDAT